MISLIVDQQAQNLNRILGYSQIPKDMLNI